MRYYYKQRLSGTGSGHRKSCSSGGSSPSLKRRLTQEEPRTSKLRSQPVALAEIANSDQTEGTPSQVRGLWREIMSSGAVRVCMRRACVVSAK
jgi:hypothetical protein